MTKPTKWMCTQRRLRSGWASAQSDQSLQCTQWVAEDPWFLHANSKDSDQTGRMPRLTWVFAGCKAILLVLCHGSYHLVNNEPINVFPQRWWEGEGGWDTLGIRLPRQSLPSGIWQTTSAQGQDLRFFSEKITKKLSLSEGMSRGFWTQNCVTWVGN